MIRRSLIVAMLVACAGVARAQSGWEARVTMAPNPLPAGRCGGIVVEVVDDHGYRRSTLSNGAPLDWRKYTFSISDPSHITVQNNPSVAGRVCADTGATASTTTVTVTLPDGLVGTLQIVLVRTDQLGQRAVVYRPQAPLRLPTSPEYAPGFVAAGATARTNGVSSGGAAGAASGGAAGAASAGAAGGAGAAATGSSIGASRAVLPPSKARLSVLQKHTTSALTMAGTYHVPPSLIVTTSNLAMGGAYHVPPSLVVTTSVLKMTGMYLTPGVLNPRNAHPTAATLPTTPTP